MTVRPEALLLVTYKGWLVFTALPLVIVSVCVIFLSRLNLIRKLVADGVDFLPHVTQLDLRDNQLGNLDATVFSGLEVLHCERNQLVALGLCGCVLKALHAASNGM